MAKRSWKVKLASERVAELAALLVEDHAENTGKGFRLCGSSGFWRTQHHGVTARFVYRSADRRTTFTYTMRGLRV